MLLIVKEVIQPPILQGSKSVEGDNGIDGNNSMMVMMMMMKTLNLVSVQSI